MANGELVIHVSRYSFSNDRGERVEGVKVTYLPEEADAEPDSRGYKPITVTSQDYTLFNSFPSVPGLYDMRFRQRAGKDGKPTLELRSADLVAPVSLDDLLGDESADLRLAAGAK